MSHKDIIKRLEKLEMKSCRKADIRIMEIYSDEYYAYKREPAAVSDRKRPRLNLILNTGKYKPREGEQ